MGEHTIKDLQKILRGHIDKDKIITDTKIESLIGPGENYGSIMLKLDITLKDERDGKEEKIHAVAKKIPANEFVKEMFNVQVTFKHEIAMYDTVVPTLQAFQEENGVSQVIDCFPELYGARINLDKDNDIVDEDAVLILENLNFSGYQMIDRHVGFDLETSQLILKDLAAFHAIPLALKLRKPEVFDEKIRSYLALFKLPSMPNKEEHDSILIEVLQDSYKCIPWIPKVKEIFKNHKATRAAPPREPFATMTHGDMWVNNTMVRFENGAPVHNKLLDFQVVDYKSPAADVVFFLFTSVQLSVLQDHLDSLIEFYHKHFISHLEKLKCDITPFIYSKFLEEISAALRTEIPHCMGMLTFIVFGKKGGSSRAFDENASPNFDELKKNISLEAKEKARYMIQVFGKRGWL